MRAAVVVLALLATACGGSPVAPAPVTVPPPSAPPLLTLNDTLPADGTQCRTFVIQTPAALTATLRWTGTAPLTLTVLRVPVTVSRVDVVGRASGSLPVGQERIAWSAEADQYAFCASQHGGTAQPYTLTVQ